MSARTKARKRAVDMLFQAAVLERDVLTVHEAEAERAKNEPDRMASWVYASEIVQGVVAHTAEINEKLASSADGWTLERMPNVDRAILQVATWEILFNEEVPGAVAVDEAVELAKEYSTEDSGRFVNGVLGRIIDLAAL